MGLSLTATSAVWALVDIKDGTILADEIVPLESVNEIARAAARSVQGFALQTERDIDGVRLTWSDDARDQGIRLRSKLRLFGFDIIETVSEQAAREGRNRTGRHIAPHLALAYGAARAQAPDDGTGLLRRLTGRVPNPVAVASGVAVIGALAVIVVAALSGSPSDTADAAVTEPAPVVVPVAPAPAAPPAPAVPRPAAPPAPVVAAQLDPTVTPQLPAAIPQQDAAPLVDEGPQAEAVPHHQAVAEPAADTEPVPDATAAVDVLPAEASPAATLAGAPHLTDDVPMAGPVPAQAARSAITTPPAPNPFDILAALP